jgi:hypothetical protein
LTPSISGKCRKNGLLRFFLLGEIINLVTLNVYPFQIFFDFGESRKNVLDFKVLSFSNILFAEVTKIILIS